MEHQMNTMDDPCFQNLPVEMQQHIFSYCGKETRREIILVCKDWTEKLRYFHEDFKLQLHDCYLREDLEPVSLLMNSTRRFRSLCLSDDIYTVSKEVQTRFFTYLGRDVQVLELEIRLENEEYFNDPDFLLFFPQLKKLIVGDLDYLSPFKSFPATLEHVHLRSLCYSKLKAEDLKHLKCIKNLKLFTSDDIYWKNDNLLESVYTFDENLKVFLESISTWSLQNLKQVSFKSNKNFLNAPKISFDDVTGIEVDKPYLLSSSLSKFPNLRFISINGYDSDQEPMCFGFHQAVLCAGVTELQLSDFKQPCFECFKSIIDSFPNLKEIRLMGSYIFTNQHAKYIFYKMPKLIHLHTDEGHLNHEIIFYDEPEYLLGNLMQLQTLNLPSFTYTQPDNMLLDWPFMPHLKEVELGAVPDDRVLNNFIENTPNLESFSIGMDYGNIPVLSQTAIELIAKTWPKLRKLELNTTLPFNETPIKEFGQNLRCLRIYISGHRNLKSVYTHASFFDAIPTLREIQIQSKIKYRYLMEWQGSDDDE